MAEPTKGADARSADVLSNSHDRRPEKRRSTDPPSEEAPKKISMSLGPPKPVALASQKISFNLSSSGDPKPKTIQMSQPSAKINAPPVKMSINLNKKPVIKTKEPPPVLQKTAVFDDSDDSEEEEMPPEAKMRMKNIGRDTPTAAGPNSYGKGKMGFTDRQKILEKQLKDEMEKVSGDSKEKKVMGSQR